MPASVQDFPDGRHQRSRARAVKFNARRPKYGPLSPRLRELLQVIEEHREIVLPTASQLCRLMGVKSRGTISAWLRMLRQKGYLPGHIISTSRSTRRVAIPH